MKTFSEIDHLIEITKLGDIVNFEGDFPLFAPLVRAITRGPEAHSAIITDINKNEREIMLTEALTSVKTTKLSTALNKNKKFNIYRVKSWTESERETAAHIARLFNSTPYGFTQIIGFYLGLITDVSTKNPFTKFDQLGQLKSMFCSQLVVWAYFKAAKYVCLEPIEWRKNVHWSMLSPSDIGYFSERVDLIYKSID